MSKVKMTVKPGQGSKLEKMPSTLTIGTKIEANVAKTDKKKGDLSAAGVPLYAPVQGQVVAIPNSKFFMSFDKVADDLINQKGRSEADFKAAGIELTKLDNGLVDIAINFPNSGLGIAGGKYIVAKAPAAAEEE